MKFVLDAHLLLALKKWLAEQGHDAVHTRDLPRKNLSDDMEVIELAVQEQRIVISTDSGFFNYFVLKGIPPKLLMITTGNIVNKDLLALFQQNFAQIEVLLQQHSVVEMSNTKILVHF
jgi:predicted nuclease of predicted toxin-antitoxin system